MSKRRDFVLGTAGHIDHGKTALVRALTGIDTDRLPAEKQRGITIDLGFASLELGERRIALIDVPGHERFVRNMLAGATGLDLAILVVAADDSVMPQTREHLEILQLLGLKAGLVVLTKCDLVDAGWLDLVEDDIGALVRGTFLEGASIVRVSAMTGFGIDGLKDSLIELCDQCPEPDDVGLFRLAIDRSFPVAGHGTVVSGTVASGSIGVGDELEWLPSGRSVRVRGLHRHDRAVERIGRGARAAVNLVGVHHSEIARGQELASPGYLVPTRVLSVELQSVTDAPRPLRHRSRYRLHLGTADVTATLALLDGSNEYSGEGAVVGQLFLAESVSAVHGEAFILRDESPPTTLGGGRILQPHARRIRRNDALAIARLRRLGGADPADRIAAVLGFLGLESWTNRSLCRDAGVALDRIPEFLDALSASGALTDLPIGPKRMTRVSVELAKALEDRLLRTLARFHEANPRQSAIGRAKVASALGYLENDAIVAGLIDRLNGEKRVVADARTVAIKGYEPKLSAGERKLKSEIADAYRAGGMTPPDPAEWTVKSNPRAAIVPELLALLCDEERLAMVGPGVYLDFDVATDLRRKVVDRLSDGSSITMAELRDLLGTTRKYAVPIGEYLDRIGLTLRDGDARRLRVSASATDHSPLGSDS